MNTARYLPKIHDLFPPWLLTDFVFPAALMGEHKKGSKYSNDVMGHLHFVLLSRLDLSNRLVDRIEGKISYYTSKVVDMNSNFSLYISLLNELYGERYSEINRAIGAFFTRSIESVKKLVPSEEGKKLQKFLYDRVVSHGRDPSWSRGSSNSFFELFTSTEGFIKTLDGVDQLMDKEGEKISVMLPQLMQLIPKVSSLISVIEEDEEIEDNDDNDDEESVEDEDEEVDDDGVDGNSNED